ncbi:hypothetical protein AVEN_33908-1 [Araneus ventricosus]|uniref:Transposase Tc1-like domain-containing protein n=1 Tax=Araneus ventricosus TaxID=182803 RepID=A0A4Y2EKE8_ARAVE|nr:hypothetical protein AVEN_33908-1 [Araneus ventricosus]
MNAVSIPGSEEFDVLSPSCIEIVQVHGVTNSATISAVDELILQNRQITTSEIAVELSTSKGTVHRIILKKLGYGKVCAQWVPKRLTENQKTARMGV